MKVWNEWNYEDSPCVMCSFLEENIGHFMTCSTYRKVAWEINWKEIFQNNVENQNSVAKNVKKKKTYIYIYEKQKASTGRPASNPGSTAP